MANIIIIGNGPAGASTALYTARAGINTMIIGKDYCALGKASEIENYYDKEVIPWIPISSMYLPLFS